MAGNIPPLVSSTPPPLNAFDDDEEEEEDEFGLYNAAEEVDYNECISFKEKDEEKQNVGKPRREQDSTSQDSATDSGLCPDSEGMSPTPHSDDERTLKQNSCEPQGCGSELGEYIGNASGMPCLNLPNGHTGEHNSSQDSDDDFGNFEFAPSHHRVQTTHTFGEGDLSSRSPSNAMKNSVEEDIGNEVLYVDPHNEQSTEKAEDIGEKLSAELNLLDSNLNGLEVNSSDFMCAEEETIQEQNNTQKDEFNVVEKLDISSSNDSSSFNSVDSSLDPKNVIYSECKKNQQPEMESTQKAIKEDLEVTDSLKSTMGNLDYREENISEIPVENGDDEFDDFTDFKANFSSCNDSSKSEQSDKLNEHFKTFVEQTKLEEATLSLHPSHQEESDDEFSNFADFSSSDCAFVSAQSSNSLENVSHIPLKLDDSDMRTESEFQDWESVFPCEDGETPLVAVALLREDDVVWSRLFPLESSPALSYQWNDSLANRRLLTALNIDSRNILFTPWNTSAVPRFAANLSCGPLEPTKAPEPMQPSVASPSIVISTTTTSNIIQESVPDAHFDWVGSGLTNPLDSCHSSLLDLNFIMTIETLLAISPKTVLNLPKTLSAEADKILTSFPDISFMRKTYIDFPINEA